MVAIDFFMWSRSNTQEVVISVNEIEDVFTLLFSNKVVGREMNQLITSYLKKSQSKYPCVIKSQVDKACDKY